MESPRECSLRFLRQLSISDPLKNACMLFFKLSVFKNHILRICLMTNIKSSIPLIGTLKRDKPTQKSGGINVSKCLDSFFPKTNCVFFLSRTVFFKNRIISQKNWWSVNLLRGQHYGRLLRLIISSFIELHLTLLAWFEKFHPWRNRHFI